MKEKILYIICVKSNKHSIVIIFIKETFTGLPSHNS